MSDAENFERAPDPELLALASELGDEIVLDDPTSLIEGARSLLERPELRAQWGVEDDIYAAVDALSTIIDLRWPNRDLPWHLERFVLWHGGEHADHVQRVLKATPLNERPSHESWRAFRERTPEETSFRETYRSLTVGGQQIDHRQQAQVAAALAALHPNGRFALEGIVIPEKVDQYQNRRVGAEMDTVAMQAVAEHLRRHAAAQAVGDFLCRHLDRLVTTGSRSRERVGDGFYTVDRALYLVDRIVGACEATEEAAREPGRTGWPTGSMQWPFLPLDEHAIERLYGHLDFDERLRILVRMSPTLLGHPAAAALEEHCRPDELVKPLLAAASHVEHLLDLAERAPGVRARVVAAVADAVAQQREISRKLIRTLIGRDPMLLSGALDGEQLRLGRGLPDALRVSLTGAVELIEPITRGGLPLVARLEMLAAIGEGAALNATMELLHALGGTSGGRLRLGAELVGRLWWVSPAQWLDLAVSWPAYLEPLAGSTRFVAWVRFHAESRARLRAGDLSVELRWQREFHPWISDGPPSSAPPPDATDAYFWLLHCLSFATDAALDAAADFIQTCEPERRDRFRYDLRDIAPATRVRLWMRQVARDPLLANQGDLFKALIALSRDELSDVFDERLAPLVWQAAFAWVQRGEGTQTLDRGAATRIIPWAAAGLVQSSTGSVEITRWLVAMLVRARAHVSDTGSLVMEGLLEFLCHIATIERSDAVLVALEMIDLVLVSEGRVRQSRQSVSVLWKPLIEARTHHRELKKRTWDGIVPELPLDGLLNSMCRRWCAEVESAPSVAVADPALPLRPEDRPACLPGFIDYLGTVIRDNADHKAFVDGLLASAFAEGGSHLERIFDIVTTAWLTHARRRWCDAVDGSHWRPDRKPASTIGRTNDAIWRLIAATDDEASDVCTRWLGALARGLAGVPDSDPMLIDGTFHIMARFSPSGSNVMLAAIESLGTEASRPVLRADQLDMHRRMAAAIAEGAIPPRPLDRRAREAHRAMIRADRRARGLA